MAISSTMMFEQFETRANPAFMEGIHSAKKSKNVLANPYLSGYLKGDNNAALWNAGFIFQLEQDVK